MNEKLLKYPDVEWSLPLFFYADYVFGTIHNIFKMSGIATPKANLFGTPACRWSGGRGPSLYKKFKKNAIRKIIKYPVFYKARPSFTFSSVGLTNDDLKDDYCNMILETAFEEDARFIVFDDRLRDYIKSKNPKATVVASIIKPIFEFQDFSKKKEYIAEEETKYYNKLLKEYDVVVVRPEYSKYELLKNYSEIDDLSKIEVLINQQCTLNCPKAIEHYSSFEPIKENKSNYVFQCFRQTYPLTKHFDYNNNSFHDEQSLQKLLKIGVKRFKIQGRSLPLPPAEVYINVINNIVKCAGSGYIFYESVNQRIAEEIDFYKKFVS